MKADFPNLKRYASENEKLLTGKNRIVFFGDSIIEFWTAKNSGIFQQANSINRGISGQTTSQMLLRFGQDVLALRPKAVIILAGINDIAQNNGPITIEAIAEHIQKMAQLALDNKIEAVLCSVLPAATIPWRSGISPADKIARLNQYLAAYCEKQGITYVDFYHAMANEDKGLDTHYTDDGLHPNKQGYQVMEKMIQPVILKIR